MVAGSSTGALVEALSLGIPVISINKASSISHDFIPEIGKGIIWGRAENAEGVRKLIAQFQNTMSENSTQLKEEGIRIRSFCFSAPTDELIGRAFEL
jgi:ABC-type Fe3+-hydroxamate transport system substrate-binding protein